jgi:butyryl-CoA dehydrogenase
VGGIGYTTIFPIERIYRDVRLASIWTGTSEVMSMITAHEWYREFLLQKAANLPRDYEADAEDAFAEEEKIYE